jgi:hypothetical protein
MHEKFEIINGIKVPESDSMYITDSLLDKTLEIVDLVLGTVEEVDISDFQILSDMKAEKANSKKDLTVEKAVTARKVWRDKAMLKLAKDEIIVTGTLNAHTYAVGLVLATVMLDLEKEIHRVEYFITKDLKLRLTPGVIEDKVSEKLSSRNTEAYIVKVKGIK